MPMRISVYAEFENGPYVMRVNKKSVNEATRSNRHLCKRNKHSASLYHNNHPSDEFRRSTLFHRLNTPDQMRRGQSASPLSSVYYLRKPRSASTTESVVARGPARALLPSLRNHRVRGKEFRLIPPPLSLNGRWSERRALSVTLGNVFVCVAVNQRFRNTFR